MDPENSCHKAARTSKITQKNRKLNYQSSMFKFHVSLLGSNLTVYINIYIIFRECNLTVHINTFHHLPPRAAPASVLPTSPWRAHPLVTAHAVPQRSGDWVSDRVHRGTGALPRLASGHLRIMAKVVKTPRWWLVLCWFYHTCHRILPTE